MKLSGPAGSGDLKHFMQTFGQSNRNNLRAVGAFTAAAVAAHAVSRGDGTRVRRQGERHPEIAGCALGQLKSRG
jgi:hypothetical protein